MLQHALYQVWVTSVRQCHGGHGCADTIKNDPAANEAALAKVCRVLGCSAMRHMLQQWVWVLVICDQLIAPSL
jgi:hypothetical protein